MLCQILYAVRVDLVHLVNELKYAFIIKDSKMENNANNANEWKEYTEDTWPEFGVKHCWTHTKMLDSVTTSAGIPDSINFSNSSKVPSVEPLFINTILVGTLLFNSRYEFPSWRVSSPIKDSSLNRGTIIDRDLNSRAFLRIGTMVIKRISSKQLQISCKKKLDL